MYMEDQAAVCEKWQMGEWKRLYFYKLGLFKNNFGNKFRCYTSEKDQKQYALRLEAADDPSAINWQNLKYQSGWKFVVQNALDFFTVIFMLVCWYGVFYLMNMKDNAKNAVDPKTHKVSMKSKMTTFAIAFGIQAINGVLA